MSAMWTWANDGTVDISEANWSPANQCDYMLWERLGENNDCIELDPEELQQDTSTHSRKRLCCREPLFSSAKDVETSTEIQKLRNPDSKIVTEDRSAEISNSNRPPPLLVDLETVSARTEDWNGFSLADETVERQNTGSQKARCDFNVPSGNGVDKRSGKDEIISTSRDRLSLPAMEKKPYEEDDDDNREGTLRDYQWEQIGNIDDMENLLESSDSSVGEAGVNQSYSLEWSSPLSQCTPATLISNVQTGESSSGPIMRSEFNGELKSNEIASTSSLSAGALEKRTVSFGDQKFFNRVNSDDDQLQLPTFQAEFHQPAYVRNHLSAGYNDINATTVSQSNGVLTFDDPSRALAEIIKAQRGQSSSFSGIIKAQQLGGQPPNHMWSEQILKREFSPTNTQHVSVLEIPRFGDLSLQHSLSVQQCPRPLPLSSSIHEISPLPDTGASPQAARMETFPLQQVPPQFAQQLPMHFMPQLHPQLLLSNPASRIEQMQIRQAHAASYQHTHPALDKIQHNQQPSGMPDGPVRPPLSGINMTPQEKIEKLRWRQQIQAKLLAAEQKQQQLSNLSTSVGYESFGIQHSADDPRNAQLDQILYNKQPRQQPLVIKLEEGAARASATHFLLQGSVEFKRNHAGIGGNEPISNDIDLHSTEKATHLDAALLHQLENAIMQLDMRTRLSMRDALYRLASSAMQRRSVNSSASGELPLPMSRFAGATTIETPTNPIDRTIANLLFYKQSFPSPRNQVHPFSTADASLPGSAPASGDSRLWAMQTPGSVALPNWGAPAQAFAIASTGQNVNLS